jgi:hypothetical protein
LRLRDLLTRDSTSFPWERPLLVALALQARSSVLLLGVWLSQAKDAFPPLLSRLRVMPAHPDWYLATLLQNLAIGLVLVWCARRLAVAWALALAVIAGSLSWLGAATHLSSSPLDGYLTVVRPVQEGIDTALLLGTLALLLRLVRTVWGMALVSAAAGTLCGIARLTLTYSVWGAPWIESWRFDLAVDALSGVAFGIALLLLVRITGGRAPAPQEQSAQRTHSVGLYQGAHGLATLALIYLQLALRFTGWRATEAPALLWIIGALTACGYGVVLAQVRQIRTALHDDRLFALYAALEVSAVPLALITLGRWHWAVASIAMLGLILVRALGALVMSRAQATPPPVASAHPRA